MTSRERVLKISQWAIQIICDNLKKKGDLGSIQSIFGHILQVIFVPVDLTLSYWHTVQMSNLVAIRHMWAVQKSISNDKCTTYLSNFVKNVNSKALVATFRANVATERIQFFTKIYYLLFKFSLEKSYNYKFF